MAAIVTRSAFVLLEATPPATSLTSLALSPRPRIDDRAVTRTALATDCSANGGRLCSTAVGAGGNDMVEQVVADPLPVMIAVRTCQTPPVLIGSLATTGLVGRSAPPILSHVGPAGTDRIDLPARPTAIEFTFRADRAHPLIIQFPPVSHCFEAPITIRPTGASDGGGASSAVSHRNRRSVISGLSPLLTLAGKLLVDS
jgi:hypothetical protein